MVATTASEAANPLPKSGDSFHFDLKMLLMARVKGLRLRTVPLPTIYAGDASHVNPVKYGLDVLAVIARYRTGTHARL